MAKDETGIDAPLTRQDKRKRVGVGLIAGGGGGNRAFEGDTVGGAAVAAVAVISGGKVAKEKIANVGAGLAIYYNSDRESRDSDWDTQGGVADGGVGSTFRL
ncbi:MAG: hypothetical protein ACTHN5_23380 [Phycisphaerae bacterium]